MKLSPADPDIETIVSRIRAGEINLQPGFQRGEVWSEAKKRRLIDSILRDWHVPPIHVIEVEETRKQEVLDGQQRLVAIRDFANGLLTVDGNAEPYDPEIAKLDGLRYGQLPAPWRRRFDRFTIRVFTISDYRPEEPAELFFRLNQPTNLTAAEQRNAFFGPARQQVKRLVGMFEEVGLTQETLGFSNSRMAYDDVIAKLCLSLDKGKLTEQVTASSVTSKYRSQQPFDERAFIRARNAIELLGRVCVGLQPPVKFNKATLYSWLCFIAEVQTASDALQSHDMSRFVQGFEQRRSRSGRHLFKGAEEYLLDTFNDRARSRVSDVSSVLVRDLILWIYFTGRVRAFQTWTEREMVASMLKPHDRRAVMLDTSFPSPVDDMSESDVALTVDHILATGWGEVL